MKPESVQGWSNRGINPKCNFYLLYPWQLASYQRNFKLKYPDSNNRNKGRYCNEPIRQSWASTNLHGLSKQQRWIEIKLCVWCEGRNKARASLRVGVFCSTMDEWCRRHLCRRLHTNNRYYSTWFMAHLPNIFYLCNTCYLVLDMHAPDITDFIASLSGQDIIFISFYFMGKKYVNRRSNMFSVQ